MTANHENGRPNGVFSTNQPSSAPSCHLHFFCQFRSRTVFCTTLCNSSYKMSHYLRMIVTTLNENSCFRARVLPFLADTTHTKRVAFTTNQRHGKSNICIWKSITHHLIQWVVTATTQNRGGYHVLYASHAWTGFEQTGTKRGGCRLRRRLTNLCCSWE